jgi:hypothetical protein
MNIRYVVKINNDGEENPYTLYKPNEDSEDTDAGEDTDADKDTGAGEAQPTKQYRQVKITGYGKKETKYNKYHIIQYNKDNDIIYLVKNPDKTQSLFLAICYSDKVMLEVFKDFGDIHKEIEKDDLNFIKNHESIIKSQYIEPYLLFLLAETVGKITEDEVIDNLKSKTKKP